MEAIRYPVRISKLRPRLFQLHTTMMMCTGIRFSGFRYLSAERIRGGERTLMQLQHASMTTTNKNRYRELKVQVMTV